jgi:CHAT domain-containing protein/NB-ARC domain-containing protein
MNPPGTGSHRSYQPWRTPATDRAWTGKHEYAHLSGDMAAGDDETFRKIALALLRLIWSPPGEPQDDSGFLPRNGGWLLQGGSSSVFIDLLTFPEPPESLGAPQVRRIGDAIDRFLRAGIAADGYLLLHNADLRSRTFREGIDAELRRLAGRVARAECWGRQRLLRDAFNAMTDHALAAARGGALAFPAVVEALRSPDGEPLERVPLRISLLSFDQYRLHAEEELSAAVGDPVDAIGERGAGNVTLLLGEFGFGKTTAAARALQRSTEILYVPGAAMSAEIKGAKDFLSRCVNTAGLLAGCSAVDRPVCDRVVRAAVEFLFKDPTLPVALVIDGLDESAFLSRQAGLQGLFNDLDRVAVPVVLAMRTEFWLSRKQEFAMSFGIIARHSGVRRRTVKAVELRPWGNAEALLFIQRARERWVDLQGNERLAQLEQLVAGGSFEKIYGDIPRRPLFLRFIVESVAEEGLPGAAVGRARLFRDWATQKILRDVGNARAAGGARPWIVAEGEPADTVVRFAWQSMLWAAACMTGEHQGVLELLPDCPLASLVERIPGVERAGDALGLHLQSLLLPVRGPTAHAPPRIAFAHRAFQEFFLAWFLLRRGELAAGWGLPASVKDWVQDLQREELVETDLHREGGDWKPLTSLQPRRPGMPSETVPIGENPDLELLVEERPGSGGRGFELRLKARDPDLDLNYRPVGGFALRADPADFFRQHLADLSQGSKPAKDWAASTAGLRAKGAFFAEILLPRELQRHLCELRGKARTLLIQSDEPWIPWELLCLPETPDGDAADGPFLCEAFALTRWLRGIRQTLFLPLHRIAAVVPRDSQLASAEGEYEDLRGLADGERRRVERIPARLRDLQEAFQKGAYDGWHFTGHGTHRDSAPDLSVIALDEREELTPAHLHGPARRMGLKHPLIFLNACSSGRTGVSLTEIGGWAPHFLRAGAGACIGALWPIDDGPARNFARVFYAAFLAGQPIAEAATTARQSVRAEGDPTWLAYTVFAHPLAVCTPRARKPGARTIASPTRYLTNAPPQPAIFVGRDRDLAELKNRLRAAAGLEDRPSIQTLTAIRGWPGVGKSTLAVELAYDGELRAEFPGGILWASIGEDPDILTELAGWGRLLGHESLAAAANLKEAVAFLKPILRERRILMILDDVWDAVHASPLQAACGGDSAILITTREPRVARAVSPLPDAVFTLQVLDESAALELLAALSPATVEQYPDACTELARALEYLPLALQVAGRLLQAEQQMGWDVRDLLQDLRRGGEILPKLAPSDRADPTGPTIPTVESLLRRSTDRLDPVARERFRLLGGFAAKPATFGLEMLRLAWNVEDPRPSVRLLVDRGLLEPAGNERFQMHALLVDHAASLEARPP